MSTLDLNALMDTVGTRVGTVTGLRVYDFAADTVAPPAAVVGLPTDVTYDFAKGRGSDALTIPVSVLVGKMSDRASRDTLSPFISGAGASSIKAAVEVDLRCRVSAARVEVVTVNGVDYLGATFDVEVVT